MIKLLISIFSVIGIATAFPTMVSVYSSEHDVKKNISKESVNQEDKRIEFRNFPLNKPQLIDITVDNRSLHLLDERGQLNQLRDWLILAIISDQEVVDRGLIKNLKNIPTIRLNNLETSHQFGETRSIDLNNGQVIALIPQELSSLQKVDSLAEIADQHRRVLQNNSASLIVFEYKLNLQKQYGLITRQASIDANTIFKSGNYGYYESTIAKEEDLFSFLAQVNTVTYAHASKQNSTLVLGGRKRNIAIPNIRLDDIATLWQSAKESSENSFSLEPQYNYAELLDSLIALKPTLISSEANLNATISEARIDKAIKGLEKQDEIPYLGLASRLIRSKQQDAIQLGEVLLTEAARNRFQKASYGKKLQGTEVGMTLFYTDLLAKTWILNYLNQIGRQRFVSFEPEQQSEGSPVNFQDSNRLSMMQLRIKANNDATTQSVMASEDGISLLLPQNITQLSAAIYDPFEGAAQKTVSSDAHILLNWWDNHYKEVLSRYEPQFYRLNELIKWGEIITWLKQNQQETQLSSLQEVKIKNDNWFPEWTKNNENQLKFQPWKQAGFYEQGYLGIQTEAFPILSTTSSSDAPSTLLFSGGVSLFADNLVLAKFRGTRIQPSRVHVDPPSVRPPRDISPDNLPPIPPNKPPKSTYSSGNSADNNIPPSPRPSPGSAQDSPKFNFVDDTLRQKNSESNSALLNVEMTSNAFEIGWQIEDTIQQQKLAADLLHNSSTPSDIEKELIQNPEIEGLVKLEQETPTYLLKLKDTDRWQMLVLEDRSDFRQSFLPLPLEKTARIKLSWVNDSTVEEQLAKNSIQKIRLPDASEAADELLTKNLRDQKYDIVIQQAIADPQRLQYYLENRLKRIDKFLQHQDFAQASLHTEELIRTYGKQPDLLMRRALTAIGRDRMHIELVSQIVASGQQAKKGNKAFLDEINRLIANNSKKFQVKRIETETAFFYVQDDPGLNNINWHEVVNPSTPSVSARARIYQARPGEIENVKLSMLGLDDSNETKEVIKSRRYANVSIQSGEDDCSENQSSDSNNCPSEKPTYVVLPPTTT